MLAVWLRPSKQIHAPIFNIKVRKKRRAIVSVRAFPSPVAELTPRQIIKYVPIFFLVIAIFVGLIAARESLF
jgi:1,3-beta-glucan synthase